MDGKYPPPPHAQEILADVNLGEGVGEYGMKKGNNFERKRKIKGK